MEKSIERHHYWKGMVAILTTFIAVAVYLFLPESCPEAARRCAFVFVIAAGFWAFEIFPLYVTSLVVVLLLIFTLAKPGGILGLDRLGYKMFLVPFASPVIMLFFGGFVLASAMRKYRVDSYLAHEILLQVGDRPYSVLIGMMLTTAFLSMWISNTATTAVMMGIIHPFHKGGDQKDPFRKALLLSIPFAANLGGMGTPIGSPPNAIAVGFLSDFGLSVNFIEWMIICVPLMLLLLLIASGVLYYLFPPSYDRLDIESIEKIILGPAGRSVVLIAFVMILLFLTSPIHGIPEPLTALLGAGLLFTTGLLDQQDFKQIHWDILVLMWGGLALGVGVEKTGLGEWIVDLPIFESRGFFLVAMLSALAFILSLFISNTASAALLLPIALSIPIENKMMLAITITLSCAIAMIFPISTPPNAIAYSTGLIKNREMVLAGSIIAIISLMVILLGYQIVIPAVIDS